MSAFEDELDKKLDECIEEMEENKDITNSAEEADEEVLELTFEQLISAINQKYLDYMKKCLSIFENHETLSKSISHDIEYLTNKLETNPYACLITLTDNYLYCFEQIKERVGK